MIKYKYILGKKGNSPVTFSLLSKAFTLKKESMTINMINFSKKNGGFQCNFKYNLIAITGFPL